MFADCHDSEIFHSEILDLYAWVPTDNGIILHEFGGTSESVEKVYLSDSLSKQCKHSDVRNLDTCILS